MRPLKGACARRQRTCPSHPLSGGLWFGDGSQDHALQTKCRHRQNEGAIADASRRLQIEREATSALAHQTDDVREWQRRCIAREASTQAASSGSAGWSCTQPGVVGHPTLAHGRQPRSEAMPVVGLLDVGRRPGGASRLHTTQTSARNGELLRYQSRTSSRYTVDLPLGDPPYDGPRW